MDKLKSIASNQYLIWLVLALPAIGLLTQFGTDDPKYGLLVHVTGEFSGRFLIVSLIATPIGMLFPKAWISKWLIQNRRFFGVAAFAYALLHTIFYLMKEPFDTVTGEFFRIGIITGWVALLIFIPLAMTSTNSAVRRMGLAWKKLQRWVYLAAVLTIVHWALVSTKHTHWLPALVQFSPVIALSAYRLWIYFKPKGIEN